MEFTDQQNALLRAPLDHTKVKSRNQAGRGVSYIEGWHAIAEANRIFGFGAWDRQTTEMRLVNEGPRQIGKGDRRKDGWSVSYVAKVLVNVGGVIREGFGAGHGIDADLGQAHESACKEAETDAMKRALMTFGNPFGLALYDKEQANVGDPMAEVKAAAARIKDAIDSAETLEDCGIDAVIDRFPAEWALLAEPTQQWMTKRVITHRANLMQSAPPNAEEEQTQGGSQ